jgi:hypothetical protein
MILSDNQDHRDENEPPSWHEEILRKRLEKINSGKVVWHDLDQAFEDLRKERPARQTDDAELSQAWHFDVLAERERLLASGQTELISLEQFSKELREELS